MKTAQTSFRSLSSNFSEAYFTNNFLFNIKHSTPLLIILKLACLPNRISANPFQSKKDCISIIEFLK